MQNNKLKKDRTLDSPYTTSGGKDTCTNVLTGETVKISNEHWGYKTQIQTFETSIDRESTYYKYIRHLPEYMILDFLTKEQWEDEDLILKFYKKTFQIQKCFLSSLPESTLEFLVNHFK